MMEFQDLGNVRRVIRLQQATLFSGGAARLTKLQSALSRFGQGDEISCVECETHLAMACHELNASDPIDFGRRKMNVFNKWKVAVIEQMIIDGAVPDAVAEVERILWIKDEGSAGDANGHSVCMHAHRDVGRFQDCQLNALSDGVSNSPSSSAAKAGEASSFTREGGAA